MLRLCRRALACAIAASLIVVSPGFECYRAFGAQWGDAKAAQASPRLVGGPKGAAKINPAEFQAAVHNGAVKLLTAAAPAPQAKGGSADPVASIQEAVGTAIQNLSRPNAGSEAVHGVGRALEELRKPGPDSGAAVPESEGAISPSASHLVKTAPRSYSRRSPASVSPVSRPSLRQGFLSRTAKAVRNVVLTALFGMVALAASAAANFLPQASTAPAVAVSSAVAVDEAEPAPALSPVTAEIAFDRQGMTVGEHVKITVTLKNPSHETVRVASLRSALEDILPEALELQGKLGDEPLALAPGASQTVSLEAIVWNSGNLKVSGPLVMDVPGSPDAAQVQVSVAEATLSVKSVLTPDWQKKGFMDIEGVKRRELPDPTWLMPFFLLGVLIVSAERLLAAKKSYPGTGGGKAPLLARTLERIKTLEAAGPALSAPSFYAELYDVLSTFLVDYHGLPVKVRDAKELAADLAASGKFGAGELEVASDLARGAEAARFGGRADNPEARRRDLAVLKSLVDQVAKRPGPKDGSLSGFWLGSALAHMSNPWVLLLIGVPYIASWAWGRLSRPAPQAYTVSSGAALPAVKSWRQKFSWLVPLFKLSKYGFILSALFLKGIDRQEVPIQTTDTELVLDLSGSMSESFSGGYNGGGASKLEAAEGALKAYMEDQRRGTTNRVGLVTFSDDAYVDSRLTTDYDALISHLPQLKSDGSTAIGKAMLAAIGNFIEVNIGDLDASADPRLQGAVQDLQKILKTRDLAAAVEYLDKHPVLKEKVLPPSQKRIVILATDGESNQGIAPKDAAAIAALLGVRVYTIGIAPTGAGNVPGYDEQTLVDVAQATGAQFFRADDADRMREVLLEISKLEKTTAKIVVVSRNDAPRQVLAGLALASLLLQLGLSNLAFRSLLQLLLVAGLPLGAILSPNEARAAAALPPVISAVANKAVPPELAEGNLLYEEGRFDDALRKYREALEKNPDLSELYFNMGNAYLRQGELDSARESFLQFLASNPSSALASQAYYNLGNAALLKGDAQQALEMYKQALRQDPDNAAAKWNLEALQKLSQKQKGQGQGKKGQKNGRGKKKGRQKPQPGQQQAQPQNQQGQKEKSGLEQLADNLRQQQKEQAEAARKAIRRTGGGMWGLAVLAVASHWALWGLLLAVPLAVGLMLYGVTRRLKDARTLTPGTAAKSLGSWWGRARFWTKTGLVAAGALTLNLAAAGLRHGFRDARENFGGKDVVVALDSSYSTFYAEDGRREKIQKELSDFDRSLEGTDRVGLVTFAGPERGTAARTASELSIDYANFDFKVVHLDAEARRLGQGTDLGAGIQGALDAFDRAKALDGRRRILILISDGEPMADGSNPSADGLKDALAAAKKRGVVIYTIGVGSVGGTEMKVPTEDGTGTEYLVDSKTNRHAVTKLDEKSLKTIASATGGAYFAAGSDVSIKGILDRIAVLEQGDKSSLIKSPRSLVGWLLGLALMLFLADDWLSAPSVLRKAGQAAPAKPSGGSSSGALLGLALPLAFWPQAFVYAGILAVLGTVLFADYATGGALFRRVRWFIQRWQGLVEKGVAAEAVKLFDLREADQERLAAFVETWRKAGASEKTALISEAAKDEGLWRQKLVSAFLYGNAPETQEEILAAIPEASKVHLESLEPVYRQVLARRGKLAWLDHGDAMDRLSRLSPAPEAAVPASPARWTAAKRIAASGLAAVVAFTGIAGVKTVQYKSDQARALQESDRIHFGEDMFVFSDRYADPAIPERALPALADWSAAPALRREKLDEAVALLVRSSDPKADNVLEVIFKHVYSPDLSREAELELLSTLIQRENDEVWRFMDGQIALSAKSSKVASRLQNMIALAGTFGSEKIFLNLFRFLKSQNEAVSGQAMQAILQSLTAKDRLGQYFDRLSAAQAKFASDPDIALWIETMALMRLGAPVEDNEQTRAVRLIDALLDSAAAYDLKRAQAVAAAKSPEEVPGSLLQAVFGTMGQVEAGMLKKSGTLPPAFSAVVKLAVNRTAKKLVLEGEALFPALHADLLKAKVVLPDSPGSTDDGGYPPSPAYREIYKLEHLRQARVSIAAAGQGVDAQAPGAEKTLEYLDRAGKAFKAMESAGKAAGMPEGTAPGDKAADEVNALLKGAYDGADGSALYDGLRAQGLASAAGADSGEGRWLDTYGRKDLAKLRKFFRDAALGVNKDFYETGHDGKRRPPTIAEKLRWLKDMEEVERIAAKYYPAAGARGPRSLWRSLGTAGEENLVLARLYNAADQSSDRALRARVLQYLERWLAGPKGRKADPAEVSDLLDVLISASAKDGQEAELWRELVRELGLHPKGLLAAAVLLQVQSKAQELVSRASEDFPQMSEALVDRRVIPGYGMERRQYKVAHLEALRGAVLAEAEKLRQKGELNDKQKADLARAEAVLPFMTRAAALAGLPQRDTAAEIMGGPVDDLLLDGYNIFPNRAFLEDLRAKGLAPKVDTTDSEQAYYHRYSRQYLLKLRKFLNEKLSSGKGYPRYRGTEPDALSSDQKTYLEKAIKEVDALIKLYPQPSQGLHGWHLLGLGALSAHLPVVGAVLAGGLILAGLYWLARRGAPVAVAQEDAAAPSRSGPAAEVMSRAQKIELAAQKFASAATAGPFRSFFRGAGGTSYADSKPYEGEDIRDIDWKTSAKQRELYAKKYELEKDMPFFLMVDVSRSSNFGTRGADKKTVIEDVSAALTLAASRMNLRVGALFFTDKVEAYIAPKNGADQSQSIVGRLFNLKPEGKGTDLRPALGAALSALPSRAIVAVVSDFLAPGFSGELSALARRHDLRVLRVFDPAEIKPIPDVGLLPVRDAETGEIREIDTSSPAFRAEQAAALSRREQAIAAAFQAAQTRAVALSTEGDYMQALQNSFDPKKTEHTGATP